MSRRRSLEPGARKAIRLGAVARDEAPPSTTVHIAGSVMASDQVATQRCSRCGRLLAMLTLTDRELLGEQYTPESLVTRTFFPLDRRIAEGPTATYLVSDRPLTADEKECAFVPAFAWED